MQRQAVKVLAIGLAAAVTLAIPATAGAKKRAATGLYDQRYCEILELKGLPPDAIVTVWNTSG